jgi:hypothetical protein
MRYLGAVIASLKTKLANCLQLLVKNLNELEKIFLVENGEQLTNGQFSSLGFNKDKFLVGPIFLSVQFGDFVESFRPLNCHPVGVFVHGPPKMSRFEDDECVIEIP